MKLIILFTVRQPHTRRDIMDDKEKIDKALKEVEEVIKWWESGQAIYLHDNPQGRALMAHIDQIKKILES